MRAYIVTDDRALNDFSSLGSAPFHSWLFLSLIFTPFYFEWESTLVKKL
jgi:hypothetical protein